MHWTDLNIVQLVKTYISDQEVRGSNLPLQQLKKKGVNTLERNFVSRNEERDLQEKKTIFLR